jgi:hypothetical protein
MHILFLYNSFLSDKYLTTYVRVKLEMSAEILVGLHAKCPLLLPHFNHNCNESVNFTLNSPIQRFMKIPEVFLKLSHEYRRREKVY